MAVPNNAYVFGTTPATGGPAALTQAIKTMLLGVNTSTTGSIPSGTTVVTPLDMTNIGTGAAVWINWGASDQECVTVTATAATTFTGGFTRAHSSGAVVQCGLPTLGVTNPWKLAVFNDAHLSGVYFSQPTTVAGDQDFVPVMWGGTANSVTYGFATADDIDNSLPTTGSFPRQSAGYGLQSSGTVSTTIVLQDTTFAWWMACCEFGIVVFVNIAGTYKCTGAMSIRTPYQNVYCGVGIASSSIPSASTTVVLTTDISNRLQTGQRVYIVNQSHTGSSTNYASLPAWMVLNSVSGSGTGTLLTFSGGVPRAFDTAAFVGLIPPKIAFGFTTLDNGSPTATRNGDGTWTSSNAQLQTIDTAVITATMQANDAPSQAPTALTAGEVDLSIYSSTAGYKGHIGFYYLVQQFVPAGVANQDVFFDPQGPSTWKAFIGTTNAQGLGPFVNPQNTLKSPTNWVP